MARKFTIEAIFSAVDRFTRPIGGMAASVDKFARRAQDSVNRIDASMSRIGGTFKTVGQGFALAGAGLGYVAQDAIRGGADFEQAMANVGAVSLMTRNEVKDLELAARRLGKSTKYSAIEVAQGMELMGKAGFTNAQVLGSIPSVLAAAAAEGAAFEETASVVSNALKGMGMDSKDNAIMARNTAQVADVLTLASARTNSSITSLGESMKNVSPVARQFGIGFNDAVASVALLQDVGLDASEAGTATATMLTKLAKPADGVAARMKQLGVEFKDAKGNMLPLTKVFGQMAKAAEKSGGNMKTVAFFADLVGLRGQKAALNLQEMFKKGRFKELADELDDATGSAQKMADLRMQTLNGDLTKFTSSVLDLKIALFDTQSGPLRDVVQSMTAWLNANQAEIVTRIGDGVKWVADNLDDIIFYGKLLGGVALGFLAVSTAVKSVKLGLEVYELASATGPAWKALGQSIVWSSGKLGIFNKAAYETYRGMGRIAAARQAINMSKIGEGLAGVDKVLGNSGILGKLGKAGLLGAALAVGVAIGLWLNDTFKLDEKISDIVGKLTGLDERMGNRDQSKTKPDMNEQHMADGSVIRADGTFIAKGADWQRHERKRNARILREADQATAGGMSVANPGSGESNAVATANRIRKTWDIGETPKTDAWGNLVFNQPTQMVSPQDRVARTIRETKDTVEITVKSDAGTKAEVSKKPRRTSIKLQPSGAL